MPPQPEQYEYLEHTADAKFRAYGKTLEEVFENAALAMFNVMIDTKKVLVETSLEISLESSELDTLLVDWLSELLFLFEVEETIFGEFRVGEIREEGGKYSLKALASGAKWDLEIHLFETEIKAVTYNQLELEKTPEGWAAQVVVDL
jgi:SHS2 domain-containing protein